MNGALFSAGGMRHGQHHLYDDLDNEITNNNKQKRKQNNKKAKKHVYTTEDVVKDSQEQQEEAEAYAEDNFEKEFDDWDPLQSCSITHSAGGLFPVPCTGADLFSLESMDKWCTN